MRRPAVHKAAAAALLLAAAGSSAAPPAGQDAYASGQVKVDVGDRKLNMYCMGKGSPTVLFEADGGRAGWDWSAVQPEVARRTRACVYDRAGMGFSDPATRAATVANATKDLHFMLKNARMDGPYVLVGAGFGAMIAQQFAARGRGNVAALVLVEPPADEELAAAAGASAGAAGSAGTAANANTGGVPQPQASAAALAAALDVALACLDAASSGNIAAAPACAYAPGGETGPRLAAAQAAQVGRPAYWRSRASEIDNLAAGASQLRAARKTFGDTPLVVLTREQSAQVAAAQQLAALSTRGSTVAVPVAVPDPRQSILSTRPEAVVGAVMGVLDRQPP
ncbi:alpha/beta fold hydrolase [Massilia sp. Root418]|jgi:pimeloyl-ACP methyl ester carboxylesterase|uniref:alpha/beta fold hydrolase n=1 Tax=Massilia sp. Root418 TaxID=1736532 RepID=UPI0009E86426|nr:alpha/beta hydrolase [Massilia sp. Root418]